MTLNNREKLIAQARQVAELLADYDRELRSPVTDLYEVDTITQMLNAHLSNPDSGDNAR